MTTVGQGVHEIHIRTEPARRVFYVTMFDAAVCLLHDLEKKTRPVEREQRQIDLRTCHSLTVHSVPEIVRRAADVARASMRATASATQSR
jgi:hypothetical protein